MLKIAIPVVCAAAVLVAVPLYILPNNQYNKAVTLMEAGQYEDAMAAFEAITIFQELGDYKDSSNQIAACQNAMDEEAYQAAVKLMESGKFIDARKQFEALGDYKDSKEQIQKCKMELLLIRKNDAIALMKDGHYASALAAFKSVEADGLDCDAEIRECEPGFLGVRNNFYPNPLYVTRGEPTGKAKKVQCSDSGKVKVHSLTRVDLDNGCVRYTVDCTLLEGCETVTVYFNTPCEYRDLSEQPQGRKTFVFDVLKKDIKASRELTIRFGESGGFIWSRNAY